MQPEYLFLQAFATKIHNSFGVFTFDGYAFTKKQMGMLERL